MLVSDLQLLLQYVALDVIHIAVIFIIGKIFIRGVVAAVLASMSASKGSAGFKERARTVEHVIRVVGNTILYGIVVFLVLEALGIDIGPLLAGAGALGLIAGIGAQTLVKDF